MNFRTTAVLFIILVAVGLLVVLTRDAGRPPTGDLPTAQKLLPLSAADVTKVSITPSEGAKVVLDRVDGKWRMSEPVNSPAEETAVSSLLTTIVGLETRGKIAADASTGFDKPAYALEVSTKAGKTIKLDIGKQSGTGDNAYLRVDGASQADVVQGAITEQLYKEPRQWRREKLFDTVATDIKQMRIATTQQSITLEKHGSDWKMTQPSEMPVDTVAASDMTMALANLRAVAFTSETSENPGRYGLDQPVVTASFSTEAPTTQPSTTQPSMITVKVGRFDDVLRKNVFASSSAAPGVVKVVATSFDALKKPTIELRDKRVVDIDMEKVTKVSIVTDKPATTQPTTREASQTTLAIARAKTTTGADATTNPAATQASTQPAAPRSRWQLASSNNADADDNKVETLLRSLHPLRADKYLAAAPELPGASVYTLTIETTDATHTIKISDPGNSQPPVATYNGLVFNLNTFFTRELEGDFVKLDNAPTPFMQPSGMPGMPPGLFPQ